LRLTARSKTSCSPRERTGLTGFFRKSSRIVGLVPSPGDVFNGLATIGAGWSRGRTDHGRRGRSDANGESNGRIKINLTRFCESQRDSVHRPSVARNELRWEIGHEMFDNPERVVADVAHSSASCAVRRDNSFRVERIFDAATQGARSSQPCTARRSLFGAAHCAARNWVENRPLQKGASRFSCKP